MTLQISKRPRKRKVARCNWRTSRLARFAPFPHTPLFLSPFSSSSYQKNRRGRKGNRHSTFVNAIPILRVFVCFVVCWVCLRLCCVVPLTDGRRCHSHMPWPPRHAQGNNSKQTATSPTTTIQTIPTTPTPTRSTNKQANSGSSNSYSWAMLLLYFCLQCRCSWIPWAALS